MAMYQNMLVVIDPNQDDQPALRRAVYLHQRIGGKIKAFLPIYDFSYEMTTLLSPDERTAMRQGVISQRTAWIHEQAKYYLNAGVPIEIKVVWHNRPFEAIIQEVISGGHDLVLKMAHQHDRLEAVIFTPTDWHLLRKCPSPVWMVKDQPWPEGGKALVAVNLASEEPYHNALNEKLVKETLQMRHLEIACSDGPHQDGDQQAYQSLKGLDITILIRIRPMHQKKINVIYPQPLQTLFARRSHALNAVPAAGKLGCYENFLTRQRSPSDSRPDAAFVFIDFGRIDQPIAYVECSLDGKGCIGIIHRPGSQAHPGH